MVQLRCLIVLFYHLTYVSDVSPNLDFATRRSGRRPAFPSACEKGEGERKSKIVANFQLQSVVQNGFCYVCVQLDRGNVGGWWIDGHRVSRANVKRAPMRRNCMGTAIVSGSHFERHLKLPWCMQMRDKDVSKIQDRILLPEFLVLMHLEGG